MYVSKSRLATAMGTATGRSGPGGGGPACGRLCRACISGAALESARWAL